MAAARLLLDSGSAGLRLQLDHEQVQTSSRDRARPLKLAGNDDAVLGVERDRTGTLYQVTAEAAAP
jgi:hypothetical protein